MNLLIDTCVLIDYIGHREPYFEEAEQVIASGFFQDSQLWISGQSLKDTCYILGKYDNTLDIQQALLHFLDIANIVSLAPDDFTRALRLNWEDLEDCLIAICAQKCNADYIITRDLKGFTKAMTPISGPSSWLETLQQEHNISYSSLTEVIPFPID